MKPEDIKLMDAEIIRLIVDWKKSGSNDVADLVISTHQAQLKKVVELINKEGYWESEEYGWAIRPELWQEIKKIAGVK